MHWFRKGLRLRDNRALLNACNGASALYPGKGDVASCALEDAAWQLLLCSIHPRPVVCKPHERWCESLPFSSAIAGGMCHFFARLAAPRRSSRKAMQDLDQSLRAVDSRLIVVRGKPVDVLPKLWKAWNISRVVSMS